RRRFNPNAMRDGVFEDQVMRDLDLAITAVDDARHFYPEGAHIGHEDELAAWIERVEANGFRVLGYFNSMISQSPDGPLAARAAEGVENGYFLADADGDFPHIWILTGGKTVELYVVDFTSAAATDFYAATFDE